MSLSLLSMGAIPFSFPGTPGVRCLFTTAAAGDMSLDGESADAALANRVRLMRTAGFARWAEVEQVHGDSLNPAGDGSGPECRGSVPADGHYTFAKGVGLVIKTGDCQPVLLARADGGAAAALHVGWRGNAMNFPGTAVERLCREFRCRAADLLAVRGPSLGPVAAEFVNFASEWPAEFLPWHDRCRRTVNLWALTRHQLERAGLPPGNIFSLDFCTRDMPDLFFSHRRKDKGRQAGVIWLER